MQPLSRQADNQQTDPSIAYSTPRALCEDRTLPRERKIALLQQWEYDLRSMAVASEENMASPDSAGTTAEFLREIRRCLYALGHRSDDRAHANKQGGDAGDK